MRKRKSSPQSEPGTSNTKTDEEKNENEKCKIESSNITSDPKKKLKQIPTKNKRLQQSFVNKPFLNQYHERGFSARKTSAVVTSKPKRYLKLKTNLLSFCKGKEFSNTSLHYKDGTTEIIKLQKTPKQLKTHKEAHAYLCLARKKKIIHEAKDIPPQSPKIIKVKSLDKMKLSKCGEPQLLYASPTPSDCSVFKQSEAILESKKVRTRIILNRTKPSSLAKLPFLNYNPRDLQNYLGCPPYDVTTFKNHMFVKIPDFERDYPPGPTYDPGNSHIYASKTFAIPCKEFLKKATMLKSIIASRAVKPELYCPKTNRRLQSIATIYIAYATCFNIHPNTWNETILDRIVDEGEDHWKRCVKIEYQNPKGDFDIMNRLVDKEITIRIKPLLEHKINKPPNLLKVLTIVFQNNVSIIFHHKDVCFLVVKKTENIFYVFDPNGRTFKCNREVCYGKASFITVQSIEGIVHILYNHSWGEYPRKYLDQSYRIYEIGLHDYGFLHKKYCGPFVDKKKKKFVVVNRFYAVVTGTIGIECPTYAEDENASLVVSYVAILYALIEPPKHWLPRTINALLHYGGQYYVSYMKAKGLESVYVNTLPTSLVLGAYSGDFNMIPYFESGFIEDIGSYRRSPLRKALLKLFRKGNHAILQIDNSSVAIWKDDKFFYVFDPIARGKNGMALAALRKKGAAVLQIHVNFDSMCRIVYLNALKTMTVGYFYLHGCDIDKIDILSANKSLKPPHSYYEHLNIFYPNKHQLKLNMKLKRPKAGAKISVIVPLECLSNLSLYPCQRADPETEFLETLMLKKQRQDMASMIERSFSLASLPEKDKVNDPDSEIISELILSDILDIVDKFVIRAEQKMHHLGIKAKAVLLTSDIYALNNLTKQLERGDIKVSDEISKRCKHKSQDKKDELTNYINTLSGVGIIQGKTLVTGNTTDDIRSMLIRGITSAYGAIVCARKYKISTWNKEIVIFASELGDQIQEEFASDADTIQALIRSRFPEIHIGCKIYTSSISLLGVFYSKGLKKVLEKFIESFNYMMLLFVSFNCAIIKRHSQYYLFFGVPCDEFGYRTGVADGCEKGLTKTCVLKIKTLQECVNRILFDRIDANEKFILIGVKPHQKDNPNCETCYNEINIAKENQLIKRHLAKDKRQEEALKIQMDCIEEVKGKELERIKFYNSLKKGKKVDIPNPENYCCSKRKAKIKQIDQSFQESPPLHCQEASPSYEAGLSECYDGTFRIIGTDYLENRKVRDLNRVRACHFASIYAILQGTILPIHKWHTGIIDSIIEKSRLLSTRINCKLIRKQRFITNMEIDNFNFEICVVKANKENEKLPSIHESIRKILLKRKYFMLQFTNATYAIYYDNYFYCFDSYSSNQNCCKNKNNHFCGASWVLFPNKKEFLNYLCYMTDEKNWTTNYNIYYIDIISFKENKCESKYSEFIKQPFKTYEITEDEPHDRCEWNKIKGEQVSWMSTGMPLWCTKTKKLNPFTNSSGNTSRAFNIEIPNELYSVFGTIHPKDAQFTMSRGKQYLAINVMACVIAHIFRVTEWNSHVLDAIVGNGDRYHCESVKRITEPDFEMALDYLNTTYRMEYYIIGIQIRKATYGTLFSYENSDDFNLTRALVYFFSQNLRYGIIQLEGRSLTFGLANKGYFMYDCQSYGPPIFESNQGTSYCLLCNSLSKLIYCIVMALNVRRCQQFVIHSIHIRIDRHCKAKEQCECKCEKRVSDRRKTARQKKIKQRNTSLLQENK